MEQYEKYPTNRIYSPEQEQYRKAHLAFVAALKEFGDADDLLMARLDAEQITFEQYAEQLETIEGLIMGEARAALDNAADALIAWAMGVVKTEQPRLWDRHFGMIQAVLEAGKMRVSIKERVIDLCMKLQPR